MEKTMNGLERAVEWLRPFAETKDWDYCVVWKLGDDPSRFIEWMGCCCSGACCEHDNVREPTLTPLCRDTHFQHPMRTKACEALAQIPYSMPLYSGLHGEAVISTQPRWICNALASDSSISNESTGTQVLIPVAGGLIELFAVKCMPKDPKIIELITAQCDFSLDQEAISGCSYTDLNLDEYYIDSLSQVNLQHWPLPLHFLSSNPRIQSIGKSSGSKKPKYNKSSLKQPAGLVSKGRLVVEDNEGKVVPKPDREGYHSKNLVTERNRRKRIKDGIYSLRALVPKITKMDNASTLGDAVDYIQELQKQVEQLKHELREMEEEDCKKDKAVLKNTTSDRIIHSSSACLSPEQKPGSGGFGEQKPTEAQVEVNQMSQRDFLIKLYCEQKRGGVTRLMEALHSLGLQVADANITTFCGKVLSILKVEAKKDMQPQKLRDYLIEIAKKRL